MSEGVRGLYIRTGKTSITRKSVTICRLNRSLFERTCERSQEHVLLEVVLLAQHAGMQISSNRMYGEADGCFETDSG